MAVGKLAIVELTVNDNGPLKLFKDFRPVNLPKSVLIVIELAINRIRMIRR